MVTVIMEMKVERDQEDVIIIELIVQGLYDDAPEEFLDTLMSTLMKDPVELPTSHNIVDFLTISNFVIILNLQKNI